MNKKQQTIKDTKENRTNILTKLGFTESTEKPNLWIKTEDGKTYCWDFRKTPRGNYYISYFEGGFMTTKEAKTTKEYTTYRKATEDIEQNNSSKQTTNEQPMNKITKTNGPPENTQVIELRGNENDITNVIKQRNLDLIIQASKDKQKPGEGILYYEQTKGSFQLIEPSVELIDIITAQMGNITVEILEKGIHNHTNIETGDMYQTYYAIVKAKDATTGSEGIGSAEEIIDYDEMNKTGRTFALTKAIRKSERNAKERLIPVPRKAMVELVKEIFKTYQQKK